MLNSKHFSLAADTVFRPYWLSQALSHETQTPPVPLDKQIECDVCIVGGGYTGLWTAIELKQQAPGLDVVIIEKQICGYGASGSNGGCALTLAPKYLSLCKYFGKEEAKRLVLASEAAVSEISRFTDQHQIDCDFRVDGSQYIASNKSQIGAMQEVVHALESAGINSWRKQSMNEATANAKIEVMLESYFSPNAGSLNPASLVRGMARVARELGVRVFENTPMTRLIDERHIPEVQTAFGCIKAKKVILAINAWMASKFKEFARSIVVVSSDMAITKPEPELLFELGLDHGASICDSRTFVLYFHTTSDGRLLFGKGGNTFAYGSKMQRSFFEPSKYGNQLKNSMARFFPRLANVEFEQVWNGGSDRSTTGFPFFGNLRGNPNIHYGFGYSGNGVVQCLLGGKILASLSLNKDNEWTRSGLVGGPRGYFPPEPIRWTGAMLVRNAIRRKEKAEDEERSPRFIDKYLSRFAASAGKSDKAS